MNNRRQLFSRSLHDVHRARVREAVREVKQLDPALFTNPQFSGVLERIAARQNIEVAALSREGIRGEARTESRQIGDYGQPTVRSFKLLDVTIPVTGNPESLTIAPSSYSLISADYELHGSAIILHLADNDLAEGAIDSFISQVNDNLSNLRREIAQFDGQLMEAAEKAAQERKREIDEDNRRDQGRKFPVTRRS